MPRAAIATTVRKAIDEISILRCRAVKPATLSQYKAGALRFAAFCASRNQYASTVWDVDNAMVTFITWSFQDAP